MALSPLRLSSHQLRIETGRYSQNRVDRAQRICTLCNKSDIEDEYHFVLVCLIYSNPRQKSRQKCIRPYCYNRPSGSKFILLMQTKQQELSEEKTTQLAGKGWSDKKTIFYLRFNAELKFKHSCKWQGMTWLWCLKNAKLRDGVYAIDKFSLRLVWTQYENYIIHAESLRLFWTKYDSYILHTSAVMYTFQNLKTAVNCNEWPDLDLGRRSNWGRGVY